ncbi:MAG: LpxI family protein [Phycisphaerae bacterium]
MSSADAEPIGLIAGQGTLPIAVARGLKAAGHPVICLGLSGQSREKELAAICDVFKRVGLIRLNQWIRVLRRHHAARTVMVGRVAKERMYARFHMVRYWPDWRSARLWLVRLRQDKRSDRLLRAVADELASGGVEIMDALPYIPELLASPGVMTQCQPGPDVHADVEFAWPLLRQVNTLLIGQSLACKDREIIAVEAVEGTDRMIERAGTLCKRGGWVLCKASNPNQDMRFDVPTIGPATITRLKQFGAAAVVVEAGRTIMLEKPELLRVADALGIVVIGRATARM